MPRKKKAFKSAFEMVRRFLRKLSSRSKLITSEEFKTLSLWHKTFYATSSLGFVAGNDLAYLQNLSKKQKASFFSFHVFTVFFLSFWYSGVLRASKMMVVARSAFIKTVPDRDKFMHQLALSGGGMWIKNMRPVRQ